MPKGKALLFYFFLSLFFCTEIFSQVIPAERLTDWNNPGSKIPFVASQSINILLHGADSTGIISSDAALQQAILSLTGQLLLSQGEAASR